MCQSYTKKLPSDFQKLSFTVLRQRFSKQKLKIIIHWQYKIFRNNYFRLELENMLLKYDFDNIDYDTVYSRLVDPR